jgi:hypothetical protein
MSIRDNSFDDDRLKDPSSEEEHTSQSTLQYFDLEGIAADDGLGYTVNVTGSHRRRKNRLRDKPPVGGVYVSTVSRQKRDASEICFLEKNAMGNAMESSTNIMSPPPTYKPNASPPVPASDHGSPEFPQFSQFSSNGHQQPLLTDHFHATPSDSPQRRVPFTSMPVPQISRPSRKSMTPSWLSPPTRGRRQPLNALNTSQGWAVPEPAVVETQPYSVQLSQPAVNGSSERKRQSRQSDNSFMREIAAMRDVMRRSEAT